MPDAVIVLPRVLTSSDTVVLVVAGDTEASACAAAETLASHPSQIANTYAVALDAAGTVIAEGGRQ